MIKSGTGGNQWNLKSGGSNVIVPVSAGTYNWQLNDVPDRAPSGPLAYYLTALLLTITGTIIQAEGGGSVITRDQLPAALINSIDWKNSWMGPVLNFQYAKGFTLPIMEFVAGGFQYGQRQENEIAATGTTPFSLTLRIPALNDNRGRLLKETSHLSALFNPSQFSVTMAALSALQSFSAGATLGAMTMNVTAQLDPRQELVLGTPMEWILHTPISGGPQVTIQGFGRDASVSGVAIKGGVAFLADLSNGINGQPGVITPHSLTDFSFPWRGQATTYDIKAWLLQQIALLPNDRPQQQHSGTNNDRMTFPYSMGSLGVPSLTSDLDELLFWPLVMGGDELELTDLQTADTDQTWNATQTGGFSTPGNHQILAEYARVWTPEKMGDWVAQIVRGGSNSLATCVLQKPALVAEVLKRVTDPNGRGLPLRYPTAKHITTVDQETYLAHQFI